VALKRGGYSKCCEAGKRHWQHEQEKYPTGTKKIAKENQYLLLDDMNL
jgi:hypothetical protein